MQRNDIETQTKKSVNDFSSSRPVQLFFAMAHLGVVDEEELERVCSERETALDRPLHQWEREIIHHHLRNESLKAVSREERIASLPNPIQAPLTPAERERDAMVARRGEFFDSMGDDPLTEETIASAELAKIFIT